MTRRRVESTDYGGFILTFEPARTERIAEILASHEEASESFSAEDWEFERRELIFLARRRPTTSIFGLALMSRMPGMGGTRRAKMRIHHPVMFDPEIHAFEAHGGEGLHRALSTAENLKRVDAGVWRSFISVVKNLRPDHANAIDELVQERTAERRLLGRDKRTINLIQQRDAIGLALDVGRMDRRMTFRRANASDDTVRSAIDLLEAQPVAERSLIEHDRRVFGSMLEGCVSSANFQDPRGYRVAVYVSDQTSLETATGVDLFVYQERYDSYLMLQYKGMERDALLQSWSYKLDGTNLIDQLSAMERVNAAAATREYVPLNVIGQRICEDPFYFKFCERTRENARDESLIPGLTLSARHLKQFLAFPEAVAGGTIRRIGYDNCARYLSNTEFVSLASNGWIGSRGATTSLINRLLGAREDGRSAVFAVLQGPPLVASGRGKMRIAT